jgi:hypothetical protein
VGARQPSTTALSPKAPTRISPINPALWTADSHASMPVVRRALTPQFATIF